MALAQTDADEMNPMATAFGDVLAQLNTSDEPTSATNTESCVISAKIDKVWSLLRWWKFE